MHAWLSDVKIKLVAFVYKQETYTITCANTFELHIYTKPSN